MFSGTYAEQAGVASKGRPAGGTTNRHGAPRARSAGPHRWKPRHIRAARLRARGETWVAVAIALGVHERTAKRYAELPGWDDLVREELGEEGRKLLDEAFLPILKNMIRIAEQQRDSDDSTPSEKEAVKAAEWVRSLWETHGPLREHDGDEGGETDSAAPTKLGTLSVVGSIRARVTTDAPATRRSDGGDDGDA